MKRVFQFEKCACQLVEKVLSVQQKLSLITDSQGYVGAKSDNLIARLQNLVFIDTN